MVFCKSCGNLLRPKRNSDGIVEVKCTTCSETSETITNFVNDEMFYNKLKNLFRSGRAEKQLKTIARSLSMPEPQIHDILKALDDKGKLPYGYYDKIERMFVRTHLTDEIPDDLMVDMIKQSYGYDIFGAKGLSNYISLGKNTSIRKVLQSLHGLRKKGILRGYKRNINWLFRLSQLKEEENSPFFPKKSDSERTSSNGKKRKSKLTNDKENETNSDMDSELIGKDKEEEEEYDPDEEEEQDDSKMVYFADQENDENN
ncbi:MAG: hypothetical protein ACC656_09120 [Candidatus Heimdallarchaeota archaeon]